MFLLNPYTLQNTSGTVLLMHFDNNFTDFSSYNRTFTTANGTPNFVTNAKFGTHAYKCSDGVSNYHNIKCSHDDGFDAITAKKQWQIDFWMNRLSSGSNETLILRKNYINNTQTSTNTSIAWSVSFNNDAKRLSFNYLYAGAAGQASVASLNNVVATLNQWYHCRIVSNGTQIKVFVDGVGGTPENIVSTGIVSSIYDFFVGVREGQFGGGQYDLILDELKIRSGFDTFSDFTPPSAPF